MGSNNDPEVLNSYSVRNDGAGPGTSGWKRGNFRETEISKVMNGMERTDRV